MMATDFVFDSDWGTVFIVELVDHPVFFPRVTMGARMSRNGYYAACVFPLGGLTYEQACSMWREMNSKLEKVEQLCAS